MYHHPSVVLFRNGRPVTVDIQLADIILRLWNAGIDTRYCCQGDEREDAYLWDVRRLDETLDVLWAGLGMESYSLDTDVYGKPPDLFSEVIRWPGAAVPSPTNACCDDHRFDRLM